MSEDTGEEKMKAILLFNKPPSRDKVTEFIRIGEAPKPKVGNKEVLVKVKASAINIEDVMTAVGRRPLVSLTPTEAAPIVLGQEFSGIVEEIGSKVTDFKVGDEILGHKLPFRIRWGTWSEYVTIGASDIVKKPADYSFAEAAALPMSALVAQAAVKTSGHLNDPLVEHPEPTEEAPLEPRDGVFCHDEKLMNEASLAVVGASSTIGSIIVQMLASRGLKVVGVCSARNAAAVLKKGAVAVYDRNKGGLKLHDAEKAAKLTIVIDAVGGQQIEDEGREALGGKGHFITIVGPGAGAFGEGTDGGMNNLGNGISIQARSFKSMFSGVKYSLASMSVSGRMTILTKLLDEKVKAILDSEVDMFDEESAKAAIDKVREHKTRGRIVFVN